MGISQPISTEDDPFQGWLQRAREGHAEATAALCLHFEDGLLAYARRKMGPRARRWDEPEDLVQEALGEVLGNPADLPPKITEGELRARLYRTAETRILDQLRRHKRDRGASVIPAGIEISSNETHSVTHHDQRELVETLVNLLPPKYQGIVRMCALEELTFVEVAERLDMHPDTVRKRYDKARGVLEQKLKERRHEA